MQAGVLPAEALGGVLGWRRAQLHPPVRLASYLAISAAPRDDVRGFLPLLRAVLAGLREERMDPTHPVRVGLLSDNAARACDYCHREIFNTCVRVRHPSLDASRAARPNPLRTGPRAPVSYRVRARVRVRVRARRTAAAWREGASSTPTAPG